MRVSFLPHRAPFLLFRLPAPKAHSFGKGNISRSPSFIFPWDRTAGLLQKRDYSAEPPSNRISTSRRFRLYEPKILRAINSAPLAWLVARFTGCLRSIESRLHGSVCIQVTAALSQHTEFYNVKTATRPSQRAENQPEPDDAGSLSDEPSRPRLKKSPWLSTIDGAALNGAHLLPTHNPGSHCGFRQYLPTEQMKT